MADLEGEDPVEQSRMEEEEEEEEVRNRYHNEVMEIFMRDIDTSLCLQQIHDAPTSQQDVSDLKQVHVCADTHAHQLQESDFIPTGSDDQYSFDSSSELSIQLSLTPSSQLDDCDSIDYEIEIETLVQLVQLDPATHLDQVPEKIQSIMLKYRIQSHVAGSSLLFQVIMSALRVNHASESEYNEYIENMFSDWKDTLKYFLPTKFSEMDALYQLQNACLESRQSFPVYPKILSCLYKYNILSQHTIVYWVNSAGRKYGPNETFLKESSKIIEGIKVGPYNHDKPISLYRPEDEY